MSSYYEGDIEIVERVPGKVTFAWNSTIRKDPRRRVSSWESPVLWFKDSSGVKHEWRLTFANKGTVSYNSGTIIARNPRMSLSIKYLSEGEGVNSTFAIKFRVTYSGFFGEDVEHYDDTKGENEFREFSHLDTYETTVFNSSQRESFKLGVLCILVTSDFHTFLDEMTLNQHDIYLKNEYELLFEGGKFSDVTFTVGEQKLHLHKSILSNRSSVFAAMFNHNFEENIYNEVRIDDQTYEVMKEFFRYLYSAKVHSIENHAAELYNLSNKYAVEGLKVLCEHVLMKTLQNENVLERLEFANLYNANNLEAKCVRYIASNAKEIVGSPSFDIHKIPAKLRNELIRLIVARS